MPASPSPSPWPGPVYAHAGGLDEFLIVAVPIAAFLLFRWIAEKRTGGREEEQDGDSTHGA